MLSSADTAVPIFAIRHTGFLSQFRAKLRDWAIRPVRAGCYHCIGQHCPLLTQRPHTLHLAYVPNQVISRIIRLACS